MPICGRCQIDKGLSEFPKNRARKDGRDVYCFPCRRLHNREMYSKHRDRYAEKSRLWRHANPRRYEETLSKRRLTPEQWLEKRQTNKTADRIEYHRQYQRTKALERDIRKIQQGPLRVRTCKSKLCPVFRSEYAGCKPCTKCGITKPLASFPKKVSACKSCHQIGRRQSHRSWAGRNREKLREAARGRRRKASPIQRSAQLARIKKAKYLRKTRLTEAVCDLTAEQWEFIKRWYDHRCAYCYQKKSLTQDHFIPISKGGSHTADNIVPACRSCNSRKQATILEDKPLPFKAMVIARIPLIPLF